MTSQLPERPNLEQLKHQAKTLLRTARANDAAAVARFRILPAFAKTPSADLAGRALALHDAQSVIAREHGFVSWNALREHVEERLFTFAGAVEEFLRCATDGASGRAQRLLALHPGIAHANLHTELVLGEAKAVEARVTEQPALATLAGGPQNWEPILYVCHTCLHRDKPERAAGLVAIARLLLAHGANPNAVYTWRWHPELPRTVLWGAICAIGHLPLAEVLLEAGANPTDGVSLHLAASGPNLPALELLLAHGVDVNGIPGGLPPLRYILDFTPSIEGPRWLLEHGADPNRTWGDLEEAAIHVAARKWEVPLVELLTRYGANLGRQRADGRTPYIIAEMHGNRAVAEWLREHGATEELTPVDRFASLCARGERQNAEILLRGQPGLRYELRPEHHLLLHRAAEQGDVAALETMLTCGFDPRSRDKDGVTALHRAAMAGSAESVRRLLEHGAPVDAQDAMFFAPPLIWAVEASHGEAAAGRDYRTVVRLLMTAGPAVEWNPPEATPGRERVFEALADLKREAAAAG